MPQVEKILADFIWKLIIARKILPWLKKKCPCLRKKNPNDEYLAQITNKNQEDLVVSKLMVNEPNALNNVILKQFDGINFGVDDDNIQNGGKQSQSVKKKKKSEKKKKKASGKDQHYGGQSEDSEEDDCGDEGLEHDQKVNVKSPAKKDVNSVANGHTCSEKVTTAKKNEN